MRHRSWRGLIAATYTAFKPDGSLQLAAVERQAVHLLNHQVRAVFIGGTTGEFQSLTLAERLALTERWMQVAEGTELQILVHVGSNCLADAQTLAADAQNRGAAAIAAVAPSYFRPRTVDLLIDGLAQISQAAPQLPFYYYDIPSMTGLNLPPTELLARVQERIPAFAGLKFSNPDLLTFQLCLRADPSRFEVLWGCDESLLAALVLGGVGAVGSTYNFAAPLYHRMLRAFEAGNLVAAREEQFRSARLIQLLASHPCGFTGAAKALLALLQLDVGPARLPQATLSPEQANTLRKDLERLGFFDWIR